jgi:hypothetical protein
VVVSLAQELYHRDRGVNPPSEEALVGKFLQEFLSFQDINIMIRQLFRNQRDSRQFVAAAMIAVCAVVLTGFLFGGKALSQDEKAKPPAAVAARPDDVKSIDAIIAAVYDVISGPAGERDWDRMRSLFVSEARLIPCFPASKDAAKPANATRVWTVDDYIKRAGPSFKTSGFFEREIARRVERFGAVAHVFSTYESRHAANDLEPFARGINSIQLFFDGTRWWTVTIFWDSERPGQTIPEDYLPKKGESRVTPSR